MKKLLMFSFLLLAPFLLSAQVKVKSYTKKDGTHVSAHTRKSPSKTKAIRAPKSSSAKTRRKKK
jgi:hypothetical protein